MAENHFETALVVVEPLQVFIVHGSDIHHYIAGIQGRRVSGSDQLCSMGGFSGGERSSWPDVANLHRRRSMFA